MSKMFAVSHIGFGNNELTTIFVEAENWRKAALCHKNIAEGFAIDDTNEEGGVPMLPLDQAQAKIEAFDQDMMINIVEVPKECNDNA